MDAVDGSGTTTVQFNPAGTILSRSSHISGRNLFSIVDNGAEVWHARSRAGALRAPGGPDPADSASAGRLYHYAYVLDGLTYAVYINGEAVKNGTLSAEEVADIYMPPEPAHPWLLGARIRYRGGDWVTDGYFGGVIDELRWWKIALSPFEVKRYMYEPVTAHPGLLQRWSFDDGPSSQNLGGLGGCGDTSRAPIQVPSPLSGSGAPVAVAAKAGDAPVDVLICATLFPAIPVTSANAVFARQPTLGTLNASGPFSLYEADRTAPASTMTRLCGKVVFRPKDPGLDSVVFMVSVQLADGSTLSTAQNLTVAVRPNQPPVAGRALAVQLNGKDQYVSLGMWDVPDDWSFGLWVQPAAVMEDSYMVSRHLANGAGLLLFGFLGGRWYLAVHCRSGCYGNPSPYGEAYFPAGADGDLVLSTGKTVAELVAMRGTAAHLLVTFKCITRGDSNGTKAQARVSLYVNGELVGVNKAFGACMHKPMSSEGYDLSTSLGEQPAPWEMGEEYEPGALDKHLPGVAVTPSNFFNGIMDDLIFWNGELSPADAVQVAAGQIPRELDTIVRYRFDLDDAALCSRRQLVDRNLTCLQVNEYAGRTMPTARFPWTNALLGDVQRVPSPFPTVPGSPLEAVMVEESCVNLTLEASDADGDAVTFSLPSPGPPEGVRLRGKELEYCAPAGRHDLTVQFDACDPSGACSSWLSGVGVAVFRVLPHGPRVVAFQLLPGQQALRLVFDMPTNAPEVSGPGALARLLQIGRLPAGTSVLSGYWEKGSQALRVLLSTVVLDAITNVTAGILEAGLLRDAGGTTYAAFGSAPPLTAVACSSGQRLPPGEVACSACPPGSYLEEEDCLPCSPGYFQDLAGQAGCLRCASGTFSATAGAVACEACPQGRTTPVPGATGFSECVCPAGMYEADASAAPAANSSGPLPCLECPQGMTCEVGSSMSDYYLVKQGMFKERRQPTFPLLQVRYWSDAETPLNVYACESKGFCPGGVPGTCSNANTIGIACALCSPYHYPAADGCHGCMKRDVVPIIVAAMVVLLLLAMLTRFGTSDIEHASSSVAAVVFTTLQLVWAVQTLGVVRLFHVTWQVPFVNILSYVKILSLDVDMLRLPCLFGHDDPITVFLIRILTLPVMAILLGVMMYVRTFWKACPAWTATPAEEQSTGFARRCLSNADRYFNAVGLLFVMLYVTITISMLEPLTCTTHPNGVRTMYSKLAIVCWETKEHVSLLAMGIIGVICYPVAILARVALATLRYPTALTRGEGVQLLRRYRFLFARFRPECYYWGLWYLIRNLMIPLVPVLFPNSTLWQVEVAASIFLLSLILQCVWLPWRTQVANMSEISCLAGLLVFLQAAGFLVGTSSRVDEYVVAQLLFAAILIVFMYAFFVVGYGLLRYFRPHDAYDVFLSHHKEGAACLARWCKMQIQYCSTASVFLDSDELDGLDLIVDIVRTSTKNLVVLLTRLTLTRIWCAAEVSAAVTYNVRMIGVACDDYSLPGRAFMQSLEQLWSPTQLTAVMQYGINLENIRMAYDKLRSQETVILDRFTAIQDQQQVIISILQTCRVGGVINHLRLRRPSLTGGTLSSTPRRPAGQTSAHIVIIGASLEAEARSTAEVLQMLVQKRTGRIVLAIHHGMQMEEQGSEADYVLVVLTRGLLHDCAFREACLACPDSADVVVALADHNFSFPSPDWYLPLEAEGPLSESAQFAAFLRRAFNIMALPISPHGSARIIGVQVEELCCRFHFRSQRHSLSRKAVADESMSPSPPGRRHSKGTVIALADGSVAFSERRWSKGALDILDWRPSMSIEEKRATQLLAAAPASPTVLLDDNNHKSMENNYKEDSHDQEAVATGESPISYCEEVSKASPELTADTCSSLGPVRKASVHSHN